MADEKSTLISRQQLASRWNVDTSTLIKWERDGMLRAVRLGAAVRYPVVEVEKIETEGTAARK